MPPRFYTSSPLLQLFVMDDDGGNVEMIGHLNLGGALHPVPLKDGRVMFSSLESAGAARPRPVGPVDASIPTAPTGGRCSAPSTAARSIRSPTSRRSSPTAASSSRSTTTRTTAASARYYKFPVEVPDGRAARSARPTATTRATRRCASAGIRKAATAGCTTSCRSAPTASTSLTPFAHPIDRPAPLSDLNDPKSPRVGKFTHPSGAPDNHLLTVWSPGPVNHNGAPSAGGRRGHLPDQGRQADRRAGRRCC